MKSIKTALGILTVLLSPSAIYAQNSERILTLGSTPPAEYLKMKPGEVKEGKFTVWNLSGEAETYQIIIRGFTQIEQYPGTAIPNTPEQESEDPYSAASWITVPFEQVEVVPQKNIDIKYTVSVPEGIALGEYHAKIFLTTESEEDISLGSQAVNNLGTGPSLLIQIGQDSEIRQEVEILKFYTDKRFYTEFDQNTQFILQLRNSGNTHITPKGNIIIRNIFGQEVERLQINRDTKSLIRGSSGQYITEWKNDRILSSDKKLIVGPLKAELILLYRSENPGFSPVRATASFFYIPLRVIIGIIVLLIVLTIYAVYRKKRKSKQS